MLMFLSMASLLSTEALADDHIGKESVQFSPSVSIGSEYRTNLYLQEGILSTDSGNTVGQPTTAGTAILINPVLKLKVNNDFISGSLGVNYRAKKYISSEEIDLSGLDRFRDVQFLTGAKILPHGIFGLQVDNSLISSGRETSADDAASAYIQSIRNNLRAGVNLKPHPESVLSASGGLVYNIVDITDAQSSKLDDPSRLNNKQSLGWYGNIQWKFLPKTSFFVDVTSETFDWENNLVYSSEECLVNFSGDCEIVSGIPNGTEMRGSLGISGRISEKLLLKLSVNYGNSTYDPDSISAGTSIGGQISDIITAVSSNVEGLDGLGTSISGALMFSDTHSLQLSYDKDFMDVYFTNYSIFHQVSAQYKVGIGDRVKLDTRFRYRIDAYSGIVDRTDTRISLNAGLEFKLQKRISFNVGGGWAQLASPDAFNVEYDDIRVHGGLILGY